MSAHALPVDYLDAPWTVQDPGASGTFNISSNGNALCIVSTSASESRVIPSPTRDGQVVTVVVGAYGGDLTLSITSGQGVSSVVLSSLGAFARLVCSSIGGSKKWIVFNTGTATNTSSSHLLLAGGTMTGNIAYTPSAITYAASVDIDFDGAAIQTLTLTGDVTITTSNKASGKTVLVKLLASGGARNFTALPSWVWVGGTAPASLASGKTALLSLTCFGSGDADVVAAYAVES